MYGTCNLLIQWDSSYWKKDKNRKHLLIQYQQDNQLSIRLKIQKETEQTKQILKSNYAALSLEVRSRIFPDDDNVFVISLYV